jgi:hypothetical protein
MAPAEEKNCDRYHPGLEEAEIGAFDEEGLAVLAPRMMAVEARGDTASRKRE